ncbi:hypothetical protein [Dongia sedimenti]|uniref:Cytosolic protein n=1 Tax=Dongia sedimenti TaxID=3064282 RepID=A0ABU0YGI0_9PROT|nr:hypothetical protein [Rhodospirillaceae bacterium R-7]
MLGRALTRAVDHEFFRWFHLVRYEAPRGLADGATWHGFRPEGARFRDLVTVNLETDRAGVIADAKLCLDRAFIEHAKDGRFAGDITASFLRWVLPEAAQKELGGFLQELGDLGPNVIRFKGLAGPLPQPSALHRVYLGQDKDAGLDLTGLTLRLTNLQARDGPRDPGHDWIWIRVARS